MPTSGCAPCSTAQGAPGGAGGWDDAGLLAAQRRLVEETLGADDGVLIIDGHETPKQGTHAVGVARQWCGHSGKRDNCQAGVFLGYASRQGDTLLDRRRYLPAAWFGEAYADRRWACRIPRDTPFQTKHVLAGDLVAAAVAAGTLRARWVLADEGYGDSPALLDRWAATGLWYLAEVACATQAWYLAEPDGQTPRARPTAWVPPRAASGKGPAPTKTRRHPASPAPQRVDAWAAQVPATQWRLFRLLEGSKGPLVAACVAVRVVMVREGLPGPEGWLLVRRTVPADGEDSAYKYYLSNAPADTPLGEVVRVSGLRWPIEACFAAGRQELGLDHDATRSWRGWHHHTTLVILAHHFLVRLQRRLDPSAGGLPTGPPAPPRRPAHPSAVGAAPAAPAGRVERDRGARPAARPAAVAAVRPGRRARLDRLPAAPQARRLPRPPPPPLAPPRRG